MVKLACFASDAYFHRLWKLICVLKVKTMAFRVNKLFICSEQKKSVSLFGC